MSHPISFPTPIRNPEQILLFQQAQQLASLTDQCKMLTALLGGRGGGGSDRQPPKKKKPLDTEKALLRNLTVERYGLEHYLPGKNHPSTSATAEITRDLFKKLDACFERKILVKEITDGLLETFRNWLLARLSDRFKAPTANKYLRQFRSVYNYAVKKKLLRPLAPIDFLEEADPEVEAWTPENYSLLEARARSLGGTVGGVPASVFWTALVLVLSKVGSRITATMRVRRQDFDRETGVLTLRRSTQKQKKEQRFALPPKAVAALEELMASHGDERIFGCWPFDPPDKNGRWKWKILAQHLSSDIVIPAGLSLQKGVKTRQFRRSTATICEENGGDPTELLGHSHRKTTERYLQRSRRRVCRQAFSIPDGRAAQTMLF